MRTVPDQAPILVTGADRSGTSLMFALLASHPRISMVRRTNLWRWFDGGFGDLSVAENLDRCLEAMLRYKRLGQLHLDPERIRREFAAGKPTYGRLFALLHVHNAMRLNKQRWGDKSLHTEYFADRVFAEFPEAKMIHMIRDPRDRYASIFKRYERRTKSVGTAMGRWLASAERGRRNMERYPDNYLIVRYESLAQSPGSTMRVVCSFIGEDYHPQMLMMSGVGEYADEGGNSSFERFAPGVISTKSIGRFRSVLSARDTAFIQFCARSRMVAHDYDLEPVRMGAADKAAFLGSHVPLNLLRLGRSLRRVSKQERPEYRVPSHRLISVGDGGLNKGRPGDARV